MYTKEHWSKQPQASGDNEFMLISSVQVMRSAAGYYLGRAARIYYMDQPDDDQGWPAPYDRLSGYFGSEEAAAQELEKSYGGGNPDPEAYWPEGHVPTLREIRECLEQAAQIEELPAP